MSESLRMSPIQIGDMIKGWLTEDGYQINPADLINTDFGWCFKTCNVLVNVVKLKNKKDVVIVSSSVILGKDKDKFIKHPQFEQLIHDIVTKYLDLGYDYFIRPNAQNPDVLEVCLPIHYDKLSKNDLSIMICKIRNCIIWTQQIIQKEVFSVTHTLDSVNSPITEGMPY